MTGPAANVELVRRMHRALRDGDGAVLERVVQRGVRWHPTSPLPEIGGDSRGPKGIRRLVDSLRAETGGTLEGEIDAYYPLGDELVVGIGRIRGTLGGRRREGDVILVHRIRNGRIVEVCGHGGGAFQRAREGARARR